MYADRLLLMTQQTITNRSTRFTYSDLVLSQSSIGPCDSFTATVTVTNAGSRDGDEVVQAYVKTPHATVPAPRVRLACASRAPRARLPARLARASRVPRVCIVCAARASRVRLACASRVPRARRACVSRVSRMHRTCASREPSAHRV